MWWRILCFSSWLNAGWYHSMRKREKWGKICGNDEKKKKKKRKFLEDAWVMKINKIPFACFPSPFTVRVAERPFSHSFGTFFPSSFSFIINSILLSRAVKHAWLHWGWFSSCFFGTDCVNTSCIKHSAFRQVQQQLPNKIPMCNIEFPDFFAALKAEIKIHFFRHFSLSLLRLISVTH